MGRTTITVDEEIKRALEQQAERRGTSVDAIIRDALEASEELQRRRLVDLIARARANSAASTENMTEDDLYRLVDEEVHAVRSERTMKS